MAKRGKLEIVKDILSIVHGNNNSIRITPLLRKSNISSARFKEYYSELIRKQFIKENNHHGSKFVSVTEKGYRFLEKYRTMINFIEEFDL